MRRDELIIDELYTPPKRELSEQEIKEVEELIKKYAKNEDEAL